MADIENLEQHLRAVRQITGDRLLTRSDTLNTQKDLHPNRIIKEGLQVQAEEIVRISADADAIEERLGQLGLELPKTYGIFTAGYQVPGNMEEVGTFGTDILINFPRPSIHGHAGKMFANEEMLVLNGRAHPTEWTNVPHAQILLAHPLRVIQELIRRQRATKGIDPIVALTYLTGVYEGHNMKPSDLGIIIDDSELTNSNHPGQGASAVFDHYIGPHFQPKLGRSGDEELMRKFVEYARSKGINIHPTMLLGTPGTPEYQSALEIGLAVSGFETALQITDIQKQADRITDAANPLSLLFGMGPTFELATLRQTQPGERDIRVLPVALATDSVGGNQSKIIDHEAVVGAAFATGARNSNLILQFIASLTHHQTNYPDHSIRSKLQKYVS